MLGCSLGNFGYKNASHGSRISIEAKCYEAHELGVYGVIFIHEHQIVEICGALHCSIPYNCIVVMGCKTSHNVVIIFIFWGEGELLAQSFVVCVKKKYCISVCRWQLANVPFGPS